MKRVHNYRSYRQEASDPTCLLGLLLGSGHPRPADLVTVGLLTCSALTLAGLLLWLFTQELTVQPAPFSLDHTVSSCPVCLTS